jgi:hypothetical protein
VVNTTPLPLYPRERDPVPIVQGAGWATGPVWKGAENQAPPGFDPQSVSSRWIKYEYWALVEWYGWEKNRSTESIIEPDYKEKYNNAHSGPTLILQRGGMTYFAFSITFHSLPLSLIYMPYTSKSKAALSKTFFLKTKSMRCNSSVSIVCNYGLDIGTRFSTGGTAFLFTATSRLSMGPTQRTLLFPQCQAALPWRWPITTI